MTPYESVLSMILAASKILHSSFAEIDAMELSTLLDLLDVWEKVNGGRENRRQVFIDEIL